MIKHLIERPVAVTMSVIALLVLGFIAMRYIPVSLMPNLEIPQITIHASAPGMSVREVNRDILSPLKGQLSQVIGLQSISTEARSDAGVIYLEFDPKTDMDLAFITVNEKIDRASQSLPEEVERPKIIKANITDIPAFYLDISLREQVRDELPEANVAFSDLGAFVRDVVGKRIEQLPETALADVTGVITPELLCIPNMEKLTSMGKDIDFLAQTIERNNLSLAALSIRDGEYRYNIQFDARIRSKEDIESIYINHEGRVYRFNELCEIVEQPSQRTGLVRSNGKNAISVAIIKQSEARMEDLKESIDALMKDLEKEYPDLRFDLTRDQTQLLSYSINSLSKNLLVGSVLACLIIFLFMGDFRSPLLIIVTIPLALILTLLVFYLLGMSINIISLSGLILGVGMMVDNSIIVIDNIMQRWEEGIPLKEAIPKAVGEVFTPMLSSILTTCSVFLPLIFLSGVAGALFYDQAMAVSISLFSSLFVSVIVLPVFFYALYRKKISKTQVFSIKIDIYYPYEVAMKWTLRHARLLLILFLLVFPATYWVYLRVEKAELPVINYDDFVVQLDWNKGINLVENDRRVAELLREIEEFTEHTTSLVGVQQFMMSHTPQLTTSEALVYVKVKDSDHLEDIQQTLSSCIEALYPDAAIEFSTSGNIFELIFSNDESNLIVNLQSKNGSAPLVADVSRVIRELQKSFPQLPIASPVLEENIIYTVDAERMALYNVSYDQIYNTLRNRVSQNQLFRINQGGFTVPVVTGDQRAEVRDILSSKVVNSQGVAVPLHLVVEEDRGLDFKQLYSNNGGDYYPIHLSIDSEEIPKVIAEIEALLVDDPALFVSFSGAYFSSRAMIADLMVILMVAITLLYFILAAQFESIIQPVIILLEIIIDLFLVLLGLWILGESLNLMSLIGIVVMSGIIINDSILKVDTINRLRKEGHGLLKAIMKAGHMRLKPILMTSLTTILAILPFLYRSDMGSDLQYPLSLTIIIGMFFGTLVSLFFIPLLYYVIYAKRR